MLLYSDLIKIYLRGDFLKTLRNNKFPYFVGKLPFYYKILNSPNNGNFPNFVDFTVGIDTETGVIIQKYDKEIDEMLNKAYGLGSQIIGYMDEYDLGIKYTQDFLNFILQNESNIRKCKILEIGCGTGYLLQSFKEKGAEVIGIEPGIENIQRNQNYNIEIINDFYPSKKIKEEFDIIIFSNVLEHIRDTKEFLINVKKQLKTNGRIYCSVPDCETPIQYGDISMLIHEHYNYFVKQSLENTFLNNIKCRATIQKSSFGSQIYAYVKNNEEELDADNCNESLNQIGNEYINKILETELLFKRFLTYISREQKKIGIYVPSRAMNMLSKIANDIQLKDIIFFDDDEKMLGKYLPGFNNRIYNRDYLKNLSLDYVLIMSYTFGDEIKKNISQILPKNCTIIKYDELFGGIEEWTF